MLRPGKKQARSLSVRARHASLGFECLESRVVLSASPLEFAPLEFRTDEARESFAAAEFAPRRTNPGQTTIVLDKNLLERSESFSVEALELPGESTPPSVESAITYVRIHASERADLFRAEARESIDRQLITPAHLPAESESAPPHVTEVSRVVENNLTREFAETVAEEFQAIASPLVAVSPSDAGDGATEVPQMHQQAKDSEGVPGSNLEPSPSHVAPVDFAPEVEAQEGDESLSGATTEVSLVANSVSLESTPIVASTDFDDLVTSAALGSDAESYDSRSFQASIENAELIDIADLGDAEIDADSDASIEQVEERARELMRNLYSPSAAAAPQRPSDLQTGVSQESQSANQVVEGGMVLLESPYASGRSELFLVDAAYEELGGLFDVEVKLSPSLGAYQAFDLGPQSAGPLLERAEARPAANGRGASRPEGLEPQALPLAQARAHSTTGPLTSAVALMTLGVFGKRKRKHDPPKG